MTLPPLLDDSNANRIGNEEPHLPIGKGSCCPGSLSLGIVVNVDARTAMGA